jgi:hypothetical protein
MQEITRPQAEKRKIHSKNEFELCYIRHQYFRRVKYNPTAEEMRPYSPIIGMLSRRTYYTYPKLFNLIGMALEDVQAIGSIHLVNFLGLFEISPTKNPEKYNDFVAVLNRKGIVEITEKELQDKNRANLTCFIKQRMEDLVKICIRKAKNIKGFCVDEFLSFYGTTPPPEDLHKLLEDNAAFGYKKLDNATLRTYRKKAKARAGVPFQWKDTWYVTVPLGQRPLTWEDLEGAGFDQRENEHNLNPEQVLLRNFEENRIDKEIKLFKIGTKEEKIMTILDFVESNADDPYYADEILIARKMLRNLGHVNVG